MKFDPENFLPNWVPGAATYLHANMSPNAIVVEWGAGASTIWLAKQVPNGFVVAAEHTKEWFDKVWKHAQYHTNIGLMKVPEVGLTYSQAPLRTCSDRQTVYIIDGLFRPRCFELAYGVADEGDIIVMDDALDYMTEFAEVEGMKDWESFKEPHPYAGTPKKDGTPHPDTKETWIWVV